MTDVTRATDETEQPGLARAIGPKLLLFFVIGDILGTGIYALTGSVAGEIGGALWLPFLLAFVVAFLTAFSYLELVGRYPRAAGAALYTHKAFGSSFLTFMVTFAVMASGVTSAATAATAFGETYLREFIELPTWAVAGAFILGLALINFRGVGESVKANLVLTCIELSGLLLVILISAFAIFGGQADFSRVVAFETPEEKNVLLAVSAATSLAFFAMVGFEDSVNMAEETKDPSRIFPKIMLTGLGITAVIYVLVSIAAVALVPVGELAGNDTPLVTVVQTAAPDFPISAVIPFISLFAVANTALLNMLMASRLLYGMSKQGVLPPFLSKVLPNRRTPWAAIVFTAAIALILITYISLDPKSPIALLLGGTTSLLLLAVFAVVNVAVLVLRKDTVEHKHFHTPRVLPVVGAIACVYLVLPWTSGRPIEQYIIAGALLVIGVILWAVTYFHRRATGYDKPADLDTTALAAIGDEVTGRDVGGPR